METQRWDAVSRFVTDRLLGSVLKNPSHYPSLIKTLRPVRASACGSAVSNLSRPGQAGVRTVPGDEHPVRLRRRPTGRAGRPAHGRRSAPVCHPLPEGPSRGLSGSTVLESELVRKPTPEAKEDDKDKLAQRQARAAAALVRLGRTEKVWPLLGHSADPRLRSFIVNWLSPLGADPHTLVAELDRLPATAKPTPPRVSSSWMRSFSTPKLRCAGR